MPIFEHFRKAMMSSDMTAVDALMSDDYVFESHRTGTKHSKADVMDMFRGSAGSAGFRIQNMRKVYENPDILVEHAIMDFPDGTRESVLSAHTIKNGKMTHTETGATPLTP